MTALAIGGGCWAKGTADERQRAVPPRPLSLCPATTPTVTLEDAAAGKSGPAGAMPHRVWPGTWLRGPLALIPAASPPPGSASPGAQAVARTSPGSCHIGEPWLRDA